MGRKGATVVYTFGLRCLRDSHAVDMTVVFVLIRDDCYSPEASRVKEIALERKGPWRRMQTLELAESGMLGKYFYAHHLQSLLKDLQARPLDEEKY